MKPTSKACIGMRRIIAEHSTKAFALLLAVSLVGFAAPASAQPRSTDRVGDASAAKQRIPLVAMPDVRMRAGILVDSAGRVLWARDASARRPMASITKIMTAVVVLESEKGNLQRKITVPRVALQVGESAAELRAGQRVTVRQLLEDLLVKSGNDAATALAVGVAGSEAAFVKRMNRKAVELGLTRTHYANPHGLDEAGQYTSARDIEVLARYAMRNPEFRRIVGIRSIRIGSGSRARRVASSNLLLSSYAGATGVKTGWTDGAGFSVAASARRGAMGLYAVVLGTASDKARFAEARTLLDWGFAHYRAQRLASAGTVVARTPVRDYLDVLIPVAVSRETSTNVIDVQGAITRNLSVESSVVAPVRRGQTVGTMTFTQQGKAIATVPLVATESVRAPTRMERIGIAIVRVWRRLFG